MDYPEVYAVDFDGTLNMAQKYPELGKPNMKLIEMLIGCRAAGDKIILWTCREGQLLDDAVEYCRKYGLEFDAINDNIQENKDRWGNNTRKVFADFYIDDRNLIFDGEELKMALSHPAAKRHGAPAITGAEETGRIPEWRKVLQQESGRIDRTNERRAEMERLTIKCEELFVPKKTCTIDRFGEVDDCDPCDSVCKSDCRNCVIQECFSRLGEYEDTGLTPEQIWVLKERDTAKAAIITGYNRAIGCKVGECPKCGAMTRDYFEFCSDCGQRLRWWYGKGNMQNGL